MASRDRRPMKRVERSDGGYAKIFLKKSSKKSCQLGKESVSLWQIKRYMKVQRFIELQTQVNNLIDSTSGPSDLLIQLVDELDKLGDSLNDEEVHKVCEWYANHQEVVIG